MNRKTILLFLVIACVCGTSTPAQDSSARDKLIAAHGQYYTPTASGLQSFHCDVAIDWKAMLTRIRGNEIADDSPILKYLRAVHLGVTDQLKGQGSLEWSDTAAPPDGKEEAAKQLRIGLQTTLAGFFQTWNAYMNGTMVPLPDRSVDVTTTETGFHLHSTASDVKTDEDFDKNMLLIQVLVEAPEIKVASVPSYVKSVDGLVVSEVASKINQPPSAPPVEADFRVEYAKVGTFQIPSHVTVDVKNVGLFEFQFSACQVSVADWAQKPAAPKPANPSN
jgi:hypothetical protein